MRDREDSSKLAGGTRSLRGVLSIVVFLILWEIGSRSKQWLGADIFTPVREALGAMGFKKNYLPWIGAVPAPTEVLHAWAGVITDAGYWQSWYKSPCGCSPDSPPRCWSASRLGAAGGESHGIRHRLPGVRGLAPDTAARMGAGVDHLLADAGALDRVRDIHRRVLHDRHQRRRRRQVDRRPLLPGGAIDGVFQVGYFPPHHPARDAAVDRGRCRGGHGHHMGSGRRG